MQLAGSASFQAKDVVSNREGAASQGSANGRE